MKNITLSKIILLFILTITFGCNKDKSAQPDTIKIYSSIKVNQTYQYYLGYFGDEEGATISRQATYFQTSKIERDINSGKIIFYYLPTQDFVGTVEIEIKTERGSDGASASNNISFTIIYLTISN